jgi:hypothetical protein
MISKFTNVFVFLIALLNANLLNAQEKAVKDIRKLANLISETRNFRKNDKVQKATKSQEKTSDLLESLKGVTLVLDKDCPLIKSIVGWGHYAYAPKCAGIDRPGIGNSIMAIEFSKSSRSILEKIDDLPEFAQFTVTFKVTSTRLAHDGDNAVLKGQITKIHTIDNPAKAADSEVKASEAESGNVDEVDPNEVLRRLKAGEVVDKNLVIKTLEKLISKE